MLAASMEVRVSKEESRNKFPVLRVANPLASWTCFFIPEGYQKLAGVVAPLNHRVLSMTPAGVEELSPVGNLLRDYS